MNIMMTEQEFDALWQRAEATPHTTRLLEEYPAWRRQRRRNLGVAASLVAVTAVVLPLLTHPLTVTDNDSYTVAYSNRPEVGNQYWVEMADALLMEA